MHYDLKANSGLQHMSINFVSAYIGMIDTLLEKTTTATYATSTAASFNI